MDGGGISPVSSPSSAAGGKFNTRASSALASASVALILLYIFWRFVWQIKKGAPRNGGIGIGIGAATSSAPSSSPSCSSQVAGGTSDTEHSENKMTELPVFVHVTAEKAECAVCLLEFGLGETGRLLPGCGHGFHAACIGSWFRVRSTCPLCRAAVNKERIVVDQFPRGA